MNRAYGRRQRVSLPVRSLGVAASRVQTAAPTKEPCHVSRASGATPFRTRMNGGSMNSVQLIGRLTHEPDPGHTPSGTPVTTFRLAIDRSGRDGADFVTVKTWERLAEASAEHLTRGRRVAVQGRLAHEEWVGSHGRRAGAAGRSRQPRRLPRRTGGHDRRRAGPQQGCQRARHRPPGGLGAWYPSLLRTQ